MQKHMIVLLLVMSLGVVLLSCGRTPEGVQVSQQRVEYRESPLGIDVQNPRFSWILISNERRVRQSAFQILVGTTEEQLNQEAGDMWDSGKVTSRRSFNIEYDGKSLVSSRRYYWKVRVWDQDGNPSPWSEVAEFQTGLLHQDDWAGQWIGAADPGISSPLLRKEFAVDREVKSASLFISGMGYFKLYLNGKAVTRPGINPAETEFGERVMYLSYDVSDRMREGMNAIGIMLGNGQFHITENENRYNKGAQRYPSPYGLPRAIVQLNITFTDGSTISLVSDESWKVSDGPITYNNFYGGEDYDARLEKTGWKTPGYDDSDWNNAVVMEQPGQLDSQIMPRMLVMQTLEPVERTNPKDGVYLFDLGQNIPGYWQIRIRGDAGTTLRIRGAETLNNERFPKPLEAQDSLSTMHDYHADAYTTYILNGEGVETYEPHFFFTGFRYIEVAATPPRQIESIEVSGKLVHTAVEQTGRFSCSNELFNQIHNRTVWAQRGNMSSIPTDCPQREKWGWTGDAHLYCEEANHNFFMPAFWSKWLNDLQDAQRIAGAGAVPDVVPNYTEWRGHAAEEWGGSGTPAWGSAYPMVYWYQYNYFNDRRVLKNHYAGVKAWADYLTSTAENSIIPWGRGDWGAPGATQHDHWERQSPVPLTSTAYYYQSVRIVEQAARILGRNEDAEHYAALGKQIKSACNERFFDPRTGQYADGSQTSNLVALDFDLVPAEYRDRVVQNVLTNIREEHDGHLFTGILGTKALVNVLPLEGHEDQLFRVASKTTYPGYGFWIENGATTLWEFWSGEASHNHAMFGPIDEFFYNDLAGIKAPGSYQTTAGYQHIHIKPTITGDLGNASASIETIRGRVSSGWELANDGLILQVQIPANAQGTVSVPTMDFTNVVVREGKTVIWEDGGTGQHVSGVESVEQGNNSIDISIGSGSYTFRLQSASSE